MSSSVYFFTKVWIYNSKGINYKISYWAFNLFIILLTIHTTVGQSVLKCTIQKSARHIAFSQSPRMPAPASEWQTLCLQVSQPNEKQNDGVKFLLRSHGLLSRECKTTFFIQIALFFSLFSSACVFNSALWSLLRLHELWVSAPPGAQTTAVTKPHRFLMPIIHQNAMCDSSRKKPHCYSFYLFYLFLKKSTLMLLSSLLISVQEQKAAATLWIPNALKMSAFLCSFTIRSVRLIDDWSTYISPLHFSSHLQQLLSSWVPPTQHLFRKITG